MAANVDHGATRGMPFGQNLSEISTPSGPGQQGITASSQTRISPEDRRLFG